MRRTTRLSIKRETASTVLVNKDKCQQIKKKLNFCNKKNETPSNDSSSESDLESYLKPANEIDLNSSFFQRQKSEEAQSFSSFESKFFSGINRLSDSESEVENEERNEEPIPTTKINFNQLHEYTKKIEEAKEVVSKYEASKRNSGTKQTTNKIDDVSNLLALGETKVPMSFTKKTQNTIRSDESHSESENDWEEVEENILKETKSNIPKEGVQITVQLPDVIRKKKGIDLISSMKRRLNRIRKENQVLVHKVHLLCWLGHGNYVNTVLNSNGLLAIALSLIPSQHCYPTERTDLKYLEQIVKWYHNTIPNIEKLISKTWSLEKILKLQITRKQAYNKQMMVYIFICILRSLGIQCRLVLSFQVANIRPPSSELHSISTKNDGNNSPSKTETAKHDKSTSPKTKTTIKKVDTPPHTSKKADTSSKVKTDKVSTKKPNLKKLTSTSKQKQSTVNGLDKESKKEKSPDRTPIQTKEMQKTKSNKQKLEKNNKCTIIQVDGMNDSDTETKNHKSDKKPNLKKLLLAKSNECPRNHPKRLRSLPNYSDINSEDDFEPKPSTSAQKDNKLNFNLKKVKEFKSTGKKIIDNNSKAINVKNDIISIMKKRIAEEKDATQTKLVKNRKKRRQNDDNDYVPESIKKKPQDSDDEFSGKTKIKVKQRVKTKRDLQEEQDKEKKGVDVWVEVYLECEEKWISADVTKGKVHCVNELYSRASRPISYIVAWNNDNSIKDISQRYCPNWNTTTRKLRINQNWWEQTLKPFKGKIVPRDKEEDEELARLQLEKPLPTSIAEYKNHPLYVLKRHLLKFEAIYPEDAVTLGFVRKEPVYSRDCVHTLHSREIWIKHAKVVKPGEKPYKIVKSRPKYDKLSGKMISDLPLEVFGPWQIEDYVPPTAENGIIPRNAYGNIDLFKSCMLPKGTVHLQLPGLNKIAKKMNIDCASAVTGFDFHSGWSHPTFDGFVVCEEYQDRLIAAWYMEQEEQEKREQEKIEKRVYGNWKKLIKGLLIRERLKAKYDYGATSKTETQGKKRKPKGPRFPTKKRKTTIQSDSDD